MMPSKSLYVHKTSPDEGCVVKHHLSKFDADLNFQIEYTLTKSPNGWICTCPARTMVCRHVRMLGIFANAEAGNDELYNKGVDLFGASHSLMLSYDGKLFDWVKGAKLTEPPEAA